jgi:hypothetical protein
MASLHVELKRGGSKDEDVSILKEILSGIQIFVSNPANMSPDYLFVAMGMRAILSVPGRGKGGFLEVCPCRDVPPKACP